MIEVDLHTHTSFSDGQLTPGELVRKAAALGIRVLSITDHDTISGLKAGQFEAMQQGVTLVAGVEISVFFQGRELHVLGYCFDPGHEALLQFLARCSDRRKDRAKAIIEKLHRLGIGLDYEGVQDYVRGDVIGRPHIAQALVDRGHVESYEAAFFRYLRNGGPADVQKELPGAGEAFDVLHAAGGIGVLAHPGHWVNDRDVVVLKELGLDGIETIHPAHDETLQAYYSELARKLSLVCTGGSDYHGMRPGDAANLGNVGLSDDQFEVFLSRCEL